MAKAFTKKYRPSPFVPSSSFTGSEAPLILRGNNMWVRYGRFGSVYAEGYTGSRDLSETISTDHFASAADLTPTTLDWTTGSKIVTGTNTTFESDLHLGSYVLGLATDGVTELFVVEKIVSNTQFIASAPATTTKTGSDGYILPVIFPVGTDRGTAVRGIVMEFPRGHYLGVGSGSFAINGNTTLGSSGTLVLSDLPQFALYDRGANTYTQDDVGIDFPATAPTIAAVAAASTGIASSTNASPIVITTSAAHRLYTGQTVVIQNHLVNTAANGEWVITKLTDTTFSLNSSTGNGVGGLTGTVSSIVSQMRAGTYNIRITNKSTRTTGFSQPSEIRDPVTLLAGQWIRITFNTAMKSDQDAYEIYGTQFLDNSTSTVQAAYNGPWYKIAEVTADMLKTTGTPTGRETGTTFDFCYTDAQISLATQILTFNNFSPVPAEFVDIINGIPIYFSCQGKGNASKGSKSPGPAAVPAKPSNPEAVFLDKTVTTAGADYIIGEFNAKSRIYTLCQNSLQTLILTTLDEAPITFRSLWNAGFRNPYNVAFVKDYLYGFSTQKILRSVAGADDFAVEFEFASDVGDYVKEWPCGHVIVAYDPKNRAVIFFYSPNEKRNSYLYTIALPFLLDKQVWNPPIILEKSDSDFVVSGAATVGESLYFLAGGKNSLGNVVVKTYEFDGGDSDTKNWYLAWTYSDDEEPLYTKNIKGGSVIGQFASSNTALKVYGVRPKDTFSISGIEAGTGADATLTLGSLPNLGRRRLVFADSGTYSLYTIRMEGSYTTTPDRLDLLTLSMEMNSSQS